MRDGSFLCQRDAVNGNADRRSIEARLGERPQEVPPGRSIAIAVERLPIPVHNGRGVERESQRPVGSFVLRVSVTECVAAS